METTIAEATTPPREHHRIVLEEYYQPDTPFSDFYVHVVNANAPSLRARFEIDQAERVAMGMLAAVAEARRRGA